MKEYYGENVNKDLMACMFEFFLLFEEFDGFVGNFSRLKKYENLLEIRKKSEGEMKEQDKSATVHNFKNNPFIFLA